MDTKTIDRILRDHPITRKFFNGVYAADKIPICNKYPCSMVINMVLYNIKYNYL